MNTRRKDLFSKVMFHGLDAQKKYRIKEINLVPGTKSAQPDNDKVFTGEYLMNMGLRWPGNSPLTSAVFELTGL